MGGGLYPDFPSEAVALIGEIFIYMQEQWTKIEDFPMYEVSNFGKVRNRHGLILKPEANSRGYLRLTLSDNKRKSRRSLASIVAAAFIGPRPVDYTINHKDGNRQNNTPENLEYITNAENFEHAITVLGRVQRLSESEWVHGIPSTYRRGCRCDVCKKGNRDRKRLKRTLQPSPWWGV